MTTNEVYKMTNYIRYPVCGLDLEPFIAFPQQGTCYIYDLYGVVNHFGNMAGGHYTAFVLSHGEWYEYDDSSVEKVTESAVKTRNAYCLFYKRRDVE